jgi:hypothetical protein
MTEKPTGKADEKRFNETLKRMLKTPPKPHISPHDVDQKTTRGLKKTKFLRKPLAKD